MRREIGQLRAAFLAVFAFSLAGSLAGAAWGLILSPRREDPGWEAWLVGLGVLDPAAFTLVGCIHNGSYLGGFAGGFVAISLLLRRKPRV
jgi:hypothetical protein